MTVKELIEQLKQFDENNEVIIDTESFFIRFRWCTLCRVTTIYNKR